MRSDLPHTLYDFKKDRGAKNTVASDEVIRLQEEANRKAQERREKEAKKGQLTMEEIFKQ